MKEPQEPASKPGSFFIKILTKFSYKILDNLFLSKTKSKTDTKKVQEKVRMK